MFGHEYYNWMETEDGYVIDWIEDETRLGWYFSELNREIFDTLFEAKVLVERWRKEYNQIRPHSSLGYRPPAPEVIYPKIQQFDKSLVN